MAITDLRGLYGGSFDQQMAVMRDSYDVARQQALSGLGRLGQSVAGLVYDDYYNGYRAPSPPKTIKDELQAEVDEWLKDTV